MFKKLIASLTAVVMVVTLTPVATLARVSPDVQEAYDWMSENDLTTTTSAEKFNGMGTLTREGLAAFVSRYLDNVIGASEPEKEACEFADIAKADPDLVDEIEAANKRGIMGINADGTCLKNFNPKGTVTRGQMEIVMSRLIRGDKYNAGGFPAHHKALKAAGIVTKDLPENGVALRYQMGLMLKRMTEKDETLNQIKEKWGGETQEDTAELCKTLSATDPMYKTLGCDKAEEQTTPEACPEGQERNAQGVCVPKQFDDTQIAQGQGTLDIKLNPETPATTTVHSIPTKGATVTFATIDFSAANDDVYLSQIDLEKIGLGTRNDIDRVWVEEDGARIGGRSSVTPDSKAVITFNPALKVEKGKTRTLELVVSLKETASAGSEHAFKFTKVTSNARTVNGANLVTPTYRTTTYEVAQVALTRIGTGTTYKAGDLEKLKLGQFKVENTYNKDDRTVVVKSMTFKNEGNGDVAKSLKNLRIERDGKVVTTNNVTYEGKYVTFRFVAGEKVAPNTNAVYTIFADVAYVDNDRGDEYQLTLTKLDQVTIYEEATKFRVGYVGKDDPNNFLLNPDGQKIGLGIFKVLGGDLILRNDEAFVANKVKDVVKGAKDIVLMSGTLTARQSVLLEDVENICVKVWTGTSNYITGQNNVEKVISRLYFVVNGQRWNGVRKGVGNSGCNVYEFDGSITVNRAVTVQVLMDSKASAPDNTKVKIDKFDLDNMRTKEYTQTQNNVQTVSYVGSLSSAEVTLKSAGLYATKIDGLGNPKKLVEGATNVTLLVAKISNTQDIPVTISELAFRMLTGDQTGGLSKYNGQVSTELYVSGSYKASATFSSQKETASYNGFTFTVEKGKPVEIKIVGTFEANKEGAMQLELYDFVGTDVNGTTYDATNAGTINIKSVTFQVTTTGAGVKVDVTQSSSNQKRFVVAGQQELGRFYVKGYNDNTVLKGLYVVAVNSGVVHSGTIVDYTNRVSTLELYDEEGNKLANGVAITTTGDVDGAGTEGYFTGKVYWFDVPNVLLADGQGKTFVVKGVVNSYSTTSEVNKDVMLVIPNSVERDTQWYSGLDVRLSNGTPVAPSNLGNYTAISRLNRFVAGYPVVALNNAETTADTAYFTITPQGGSTIVVSGFTITAGNVWNDGYTIYLGNIGGEVVCTKSGSSSCASFSGVEVNSETRFAVKFNKVATSAAGENGSFTVDDVEYAQKVEGSLSSSSKAKGYFGVGLPSNTAYFPKN